MATTQLLRENPHTAGCFKVTVVAGRDKGAAAASFEGRFTVGTAEGNTLRLNDPTVSRYHAELEATPEGVLLRDLGSTNGVLLGPAHLREALLTESTEVDLGRTRLRVAIASEREVLVLPERASFGPLIGASAAMRAIYATLERAAPTGAPVLVTGESGTGKELAARAVHEASPRAGAAFVVVDCGAMLSTLIESELFGHEKGAFTGAHVAREGAFERAHGGTLFLDEMGELPLDLQPKLLRALGEGEVRRVGGDRIRKVDVRVVAATNRDLRREVNSGRFRADLYYRLAVILVRMPSLRDRLEDLPLIVPALLDRIVMQRKLPVAPRCDDALLRVLGRHTWPGNVRELKNYLEQYAILESLPPFEATEGEPGALPHLSEGLHAMPFRAAKEELLRRFEMHYLQALLEETSGNESEAARRAGIDRVTVFRALRRLGLKSA
jgi:two-component system response regulator GlrR